MLRSLLFTLVLLCASVAHATVLGMAPEPLGEFDVVRIPLRQVGNLMLIEAKVDGQTGYFILDTGAPYLVLNETYFREGKQVDQRVMGDVNGYLDTVNVIGVQRLELRSLYFENLEADLANLGSIEDKRGVKILGLMGLDIFLNVEMRFNLPGLTLELHRTNKQGECVSPIPQCVGDASIVDFKVRKNILILKGQIAGKTLNLCLDSGAEVMVLSNDLPEEVYGEVTVRGSKMLLGSSGQSTEVLFGSLRSITLDKPIKYCQVVITDLDEMSLSYGVKIDGMIGFDLFARGTVILNFQKKQLTFCPKS